MKIIYQTLVFLLLLSCVAVKAEQPLTEESQKLMSELQAEINRTLYQVALIEAKQGMAMTDFHYAISSGGQRELGLILQFVSHKGFLVLAKSPTTMAQTKGILVGDIISQVDGQPLNLSNAKKAYDRLNQRYEKGSIRLTLLKQNKETVDVNVTLTIKPEFELIIGSATER